MRESKPPYTERLYGEATCRAPAHSPAEVPVYTWEWNCLQKIQPLATKSSLVFKFSQMRSQQEQVTLLCSNSGPQNPWVWQNGCFFITKFLGMLLLSNSNWNLSPPSTWTKPTQKTSLSDRLALVSCPHLQIEANSISCLVYKSWGRTCPWPEPLQDSWGSIHIRNNHYCECEPRLWAHKPLNSQLGLYKNT